MLARLSIVAGLVVGVAVAGLLLGGLLAFAPEAPPPSVAVPTLGLESLAPSVAPSAAGSAAPDAPSTAPGASEAPEGNLATPSPASSAAVFQGRESGVDVTP